MVPMDFHNKILSELTDDEMMFIHLSGIQISISDRTLRSCIETLWANVNQGMLLANSKEIMPVLSMLSILDCIGICYNLKNKESRKENGIKKAIDLFGANTTLPKNDLINLTYALRNGLSHSISWVSFSKHTPPNHFVFQRDDLISDIYQNSNEEWDGNYIKLDTQKNKYITKVNIIKLKIYISEIIDKVREEFNNNNLQIALSNGKSELFHRYIFE